MERVIKRVTIFVDANLKRTLDGISTPRQRVGTAPCKCGATEWQERPPSPKSPGKVAYICEACGRRVTRARSLKGVVSAVDGTGVVDGLIKQYLRSPSAIAKHVPATKVKLGIFLHRDLHAKAWALAEKREMRLSSLLASIIAAKVQPQRERAA